MSYGLCSAEAQEGVAAPVGAGVNAVDRVVQRVREQVLRGELNAGTRLSQEALAHQLGVSRIPVRDALRVLHTEGLVDLQGRAGAVVSSMGLDDLQEIYELTEAVEPLACRLGTPNTGRAEIARMIHYHERMQAITDNMEWLEANALFHSTLYLACRRPRLIEFLGTLRRLKDRYLMLYLNLSKDAEQHHVQHEELIGTVERRDLEAVERITLEHLHSSHEVLVQHFIRLEDTAATA